MALAIEDSPAFMLGGFEMASAVLADEPKLAEAFRTGEGVGWHEHDHRLFGGVERFFRPGYRANLVDAWLPALDGVEEKLRSGAKVADVGCGHGASTILMAEAYPNSTFAGFDYHEESIAAAREAADAAGLGDRLTFEVAAAKEIPGSGYDLVCFFDCLHDMGDPEGALRHTKGKLADDGTVMMVEPFAGDDVEENLNPIGRVYYCASTMLCTPGSLDQEVGLALGAQAGETRLAEVAGNAGFSRFRRATDTPLNLVLEARP
jgi:SAM-dependent methyltransferase